MMSKTERSAEEWIDQYAKKLSVDAPTAQEIEVLLKIAAEAAHSSERVAAPIACWMAGKVNIDLQEAYEKACSQKDDF